MLSGRITKVGLLALVISLALLVAACGGGGGAQTTTGGGTSAVTAGAGGKELTFSPNTLTGKQGQKLALTVKNDGALPHTFVITELGVKTAPVESKKSITVDITPSTAGSFKFFCDVPGHREAGMEGTITVS